MSDSPLAPTPAALSQRRAYVISRLCDHFANDHLEADELQDLLDRAHQAQTLVALDDLLVGLPEAAPEGMSSVAPPDAIPADRREQEVVVAVLGGTERKGAWVPARRIHVIAAMGGSSLDFREARLPAGVTTLHAFAVMGGIEIIVPPGLRVESDGVGIMGGFSHNSRDASIDAEGPVLRVTGLALMGGVEITEKAPRGRKRLPS